MSGTVFFRYKNGSSFLHKMPPVLKLLLMIAFCVLAFYVPANCALFLYIALIFFAVFYLKFTLKEILADNIPSLIYVLTLYLICLLSNFYALINPEIEKNFLPLKNEFFTKLIFVLTPDEKFFPSGIHLCLSVQISSIFYRSTSPLQFNSAFKQIEHFVFRREKTPVAETLSLTINFIPGIARLWNRIDSAWISRGGKKNVKRISSLTPILFKTAMSDAYKKSLAKMNREN